MGSGSPPDVCPLSSSLKVLGKKAAEHLKWLPKKRSNHYRSVLKLTKTCWTAERHSSPVTPAARDSGRKRKHRRSWSLCKCAWCWWVGPCFDLNHSIKRVENFLSYPMRWDDWTSWNELLATPELRRKCSTIRDETIFCISYLAFCWICIARFYSFFISIFIHILNDLVAWLNFWPQLNWEQMPWNPWNYI